MSAGSIVGIDASDARALTDRIKVEVKAVWELVKQAYEERAWLALGYSSWDDYCTREFGTTRLRLPREERAEVVASLRESGLSIRAIASATGDHYSTVSRELSGVAFATPDRGVRFRAPELSADESAVAPGGLTEDSPGQTGRMQQALERARNAARVIGTDGKSYQPEQTQPLRKSRRKPITDEFDHEVFKWRPRVERLKKLAADDRIVPNRDGLVGCRNDLIRFRNTLNDVITKLGGGPE